MKGMQLEAGKKRLLFFFTMLLMGAVCVILYLCLTGNTNQVYTDVVYENTAFWGSNKSAERVLFYVFSLIGAVLYSLFYLMNKSVHDDAGIIETNLNKFVMIGLITLCMTSCFVWSELNWLVIAAVILTIIVLFKAENMVVDAIAFFVICSYSVCAIYRLYVLCGGLRSLSIINVALISLIISMGIALFFSGRKAFLKGIMVCQLLIPFTLLTYLASSYMYNESNLISIQIPLQIRCIVLAIIVFFIIEAVYTIKCKWKSEIVLQDILTFGTCVSIMTFNRFSGSGSIIPMDLHHPYENIIGYSQVFELGQKMFSQYIPVSGMYSIIHGFFLAFAGNDQVSFYAISTNIFYMSSIFIIVFLLRRQLKAEWVLLISVMHMVTDYNRHLLMVPVILLLAWPKLIERKNLWLMAWFMTSFIQGLYYPVFGAAVCVAFIPLGIWQMYTYIKKGALAKDIRTFKFWIGWVVCFLPVICSTKLLLGTIKHMIAMGGQTIFADGITRFGQTIPENFFSYIQSLSTRLVIYYLFSYMIIISIVWISVSIFLKAGKVYFDNKIIRIDNPVEGFLALSIGLMMLVSISYTVVRLDIDDIYARSDGVVRACFVILILLIARYLNGSHANTIWIFAFACFIISSNQGEAFAGMGDNSKLDAFYKVPEGYVYVVDDAVERLGKCFVEENTYNAIESSYLATRSLDREKSYLGLYYTFGMFFLNEIKADSVMEMLTIRGYDATKETVELLRENSTIVGSYLNSLNNYYLYHWLVTSGEYYWDSEIKCFVPSNDEIASDKIFEQNKYIPLAEEGLVLGRTAGSWGSSITSLKGLFTQYNIGYDIITIDSADIITFDHIVNGEDADFLYVEFGNLVDEVDYILYNLDAGYIINKDKYRFGKYLMKKEYNSNLFVVVAWMDENGDEHSMKCNMDEGKLLIPLGSGRGWLLNNHSDLKIYVMQGEHMIPVPSIVDIELLKLREV